LKIEATFVTSAAGAADFPRAGLPEVALIGRSNVGKSSLINALARRRVARTSAAPGKTRLANVYRVQRGSAPPFHLVDLPGFGYSTGGSAAGRQFADVTAAYFGRGPSQMAALLLVDVRHPGLDSDQAAWRWLKSVLEHAGIVATKVDKLARGARIRALRELESVFEDAVLPVSAVTGEGLDELWRLIDNLVNNRQPHPHRKRAPKATAPPPPTE
jgi:GTP-binding protein